MEYGWLRSEPTSPNEIKSLLGIVDRSLTDSKVEAVSTDLRFIAAFNAALCIATLALRATGHRTVTQAGHHVKTIESLEFTLKPNATIIQKFKTFKLTAREFRVFPVKKRLWQLVEVAIEESNAVLVDKSCFGSMSQT